MKKYTYIKIAQEDNEFLHNKPRYTIRNNKSEDILGFLEYYPRWKTFIFCPEFMCVFNPSCLIDIIDFMTNHAGK